MKKLLLFSACVAMLCAAIGCAEKGKNDTIKVVSYNIRMSGSPAADGDNYWANRKQASINMVSTSICLSTSTSASAARTARPRAK